MIDAFRSGFTSNVLDHLNNLALKLLVCYTIKLYRQIVTHLVR